MKSKRYPIYYEIERREVSVAMPETPIWRESVNSIPQSDLFISEPNSQYLRYAFNLRKDFKNFIEDKSYFFNYFTSDLFSDNDLINLANRSTVIKNFLFNFLKEEPRSISDQTYIEMAKFASLTNLDANPNLIEEKYSPEELSVLEQAAVLPLDLLRGDAFVSFKKYIEKLSPEEKQAIDNLPGIRSQLSTYQLGTSLSNIFKLPPQSCLGGTAGICREIIKTKDFFKQLNRIAKTGIFGEMKESAVPEHEEKKAAESAAIATTKKLQTDPVFWKNFKVKLINVVEGSMAEFKRVNKLDQDVGLLNRLFSKHGKKGLIRANALLTEVKACAGGTVNDDEIAKAIFDNIYKTLTSSEGGWDKTSLKTILFKNLNAQLPEGLKRLELEELHKQFHLADGMSLSRTEGH